MGRVITNIAHYREDVKIVAGYDLNDTLPNDYPVFTQLDQCNVSVDVMIDFSHPRFASGRGICRFKKDPSGHGHNRSV